MADSDFKYTTEPLDEKEDVLGVFYGGRGQVGQQLIVTNRRLLFGPVDTGLAQSILGYGLDKAGVPGVDFVKEVLTKYSPMQPKTVWLRHVSEVQPGGSGGLFKPPGLVISLATHEKLEFSVVDTPTTRNPSPRNKAARDQAIATIRKAVAASRAAEI